MEIFFWLFSEWRQKSLYLAKAMKVKYSDTWLRHGGLIFMLGKCVLWFIMGGRIQVAELGLPHLMGGEEDVWCTRMCLDLAWHPLLHPCLGGCHCIPS